MHDGEGIKSRSQIVDHNASAFGQPFQPPDGKWLPDIEDTEKYKAQEKSFPSERDSDKRNQLPRDFIDDDELRIFRAGGARDTCSGRNSDERYSRCCNDCCPGAIRGWDLRTCQPPQNNRG